MIKVIVLMGLIIPLITIGQKDDYSSYPVYSGKDLGLQYSPEHSSFRIWAPTATEAQLLFYNDGIDGTSTQTIDMQKSEAGTWIASAEGDQKGKFYVFRVRVDNKWMQEVPDPYARAVGVNGKRAMIVDPRDTDPAQWSADISPIHRNPTDAIIYELHIRDASIALNSGINNKGKFIGLTEKGTTNREGLSTGLDHLVELGVTHVHLLPIFDFLSVDETKPGEPQYNWGYEPLNYNAPEGSYSTNAKDGVTRNRELKELVKTFHQNGLSIVMDVVYNHTMLTEDSYFNQLVPGYYYRQTPEGKFSNGTACGNETASERPMMRKFMLESLQFWVQEYHIDGFRFDLMGIHDIETMNIISKELRKIKPGILLYGEGWTAGASPLPVEARALKKYAYRLDNIAVFSDDIRDGIKGSVFVNEERGFASGRPGMKESIKFGIVASVKHPQVNYDKVNYSKAPYAAEPSNTITYTECHDNHVLWDKLAISAKDATEEERKQMHKLALSIVLTSQGISFLHAGTEFLRSKKGHENSYNAGDSINAIDWSLKTKNKDVLDYVKALIKMRKEHPAFRMKTAKEITENIHFMDNLPEGIIGYSINGIGLNDSWKKIIVYFNGTSKTQQLAFPQGTWSSAVLDSFVSPFGKNAEPRDKLNLAKYSCSIFYQE